MSWKPMDTAPKDGSVRSCMQTMGRSRLTPVDVFHAYYEESEGHWDSLVEDIPFHMSFVQATLLGYRSAR